MFCYSDSLAQLIYEEIFSWILARISFVSKCSDPNGAIAIFDFYGVEVNNRDYFSLFDMLKHDTELKRRP